MTGIVRDRPCGELSAAARSGRENTDRRRRHHRSGFCRRVINEHEIEDRLPPRRAGDRGLANRSPLSTLESNIRGTYVLLEACRELRADTLPAPGHRRGQQRQGLRRSGGTALPRKPAASGPHPYDASKSCADLITRAYPIPMLCRWQ